MPTGQTWNLNEPYQASVSAELQRLERVIVRVWQLTSLFGVVTGAIYALAVARDLGLGCTAASAVFLVWFALIGYALDHGSVSASVLVANTLAEALIPWTFLIVIMYAKGASYALASWVPPFLFCSCIVAYVARLRPWLPLVFGAAGSLVYPLVYFGLIRNELTADAKLELINQPVTQVTRSVALLGAGVIAMLLAVGLRHVVRTAYKRARTGEVLGKYQLGREVGASPTGIVHSARYYPAGGFERRLMVRILPPATSDRPELVAAFANQAELASRLVHPNIVQVVDFGTWEDKYVVVTEYMDAIHLAMLQKRVLATATALDPALVRHIGVSILSALEYAHEGARHDDGTALRHFHRDLCPERVFLYRTGQIKIGGFSLPSSLRDFDRMRETHLAYTPPEQPSGVIDERSDLFATGAMLWELVAAQPFVLADALQFRFDPESGWNAFFERTLAPNPDSRASSARELRAMLEPFAEPMREKATRTMSSLVNELMRQNRERASETSAHHDTR